MKSEKISKIAMLAAVGIIFGYVESLFPLPLPVYGAKLGISNAAVLCALYLLNVPSAWGIMLIKTVCTALLFGSPSTLIYSLFGGVLSLLLMIGLKKSRILGIAGISALAGAAHNVGQLLCAVIITRTAGLWYYLPALLLFGALAGTVIGILSKIILERIGKYKF